MIDLAFTDEQLALAATARELFENESPPSRLRAIWEGAEVGGAVWKTMAGVGLLGIVVPEEHGGLGGDETDLVLVLEEAGRAALPEPLAECAIAARILTDGTVLRAIAAGEQLVLAQVGPYAVDADAASAVIVDGRVYTAFTAERVPSIDHGRRLFRVMPTDDGEPVAGGGSSAPWAIASVLNGVSMRLLEMTVDHARQRHQFGAPIGSFQAVKHQLATGHALLTAARAAAHGAAWTLANVPEDAAFAASVAAHEARAAHSSINRAALQVHGGIGFTWEHDLHLWLKRGIALAGLVDGPPPDVRGYIHGKDAHA